MMVLWNREFSDRFSQWFSVNKKVVTNLTDMTLDRGKDKTIKIENQIRRTDRKRGGLKETEVWRFQSKFIDSFLGAGAKVVDRSSAIRLTAVSKTAGSTPDTQRVETQALQGYADLLVEVLLAKNGKQPIFKLTVKDINNGQLVAQVFSDDKSNSGKELKFEPDPGGGFREVTQPDSRPSDFAHELAIMLMSSLNKVWGL